MFAKLVTKIAPNTFNVSANVYYNTLIGVITGSITSNTQLNSNVFEQAASFITTTVPSGWSINDSQANTPGYFSILPGANIFVISAPWTDSANNAKYVWIAPKNSSNTTLAVVGMPMEGWNSTTKTIGNTFFAQAGLLTLQANSTTTGNSFTSLYYNLVSPMSVPVTANSGTVTIISASQAHLFVASYQGQLGTTFNNYWYLSEYTRDDPWSTVENNYPSWFFEGNANNTGGWSSLQTSGHLARIFNTATGIDNSWVSMSSAGSAAAYDWGIASRMVPYGTSSAGILTAGVFPYVVRGIGAAGLGQVFQGNYAFARDINRNVAGSVSEMRVVSVGLGSANIVPGATMFAGGSINAVAPFIYLTRSQYQNLDELDFGDGRYMNLIVNNGIAGQTNASNILVREA